MKRHPSTISASMKRTEALNLLACWDGGAGARLYHLSIRDHSDDEGSRVVSCPTEDEAREYIREQEEVNLMEIREAISGWLISDAGRCEDHLRQAYVL